MLLFCIYVVSSNVWLPPAIHSCLLPCPVHPLLFPLTCTSHNTFTLSSLSLSSPLLSSVSSWSVFALLPVLRSVEQTKAPFTQDWLTAQSQHDDVIRVQSSDTPGHMDTNQVSIWFSATSLPGHITICCAPFKIKDQISKEQRLQNFTLFLSETVMLSPWLQVHHKQEVTIEGTVWPNVSRFSLYSCNIIKPWLQKSASSFLSKRGFRSSDHLGLTLARCLSGESSPITNSHEEKKKTCVKVTMSPKSPQRSLSWVKGRKKNNVWKHPSCCTQLPVAHQDLETWDYCYYRLWNLKVSAHKNLLLHVYIRLFPEYLGSWFFIFVVHLFRCWTAAASCFVYFKLQMLKTVFSVCSTLKINKTKSVNS